MRSTSLLIRSGRLSFAEHLRLWLDISQRPALVAPAHARLHLRKMKKSDRSEEATYFLCPPGGGIEMSTFVTGPKDESGRSKSAVLPTTRIAN